MIKEIFDPDERAQIVAEVLTDLPDWFGIEEATQAYIKQARSLQVWAAYSKEDLQGFISLSYSSPDCAEIACMGVKQTYHGKGVGRELLSALETEAVQKVNVLQVKTVAPGYYVAYDKTNRFYQAMGFKQLEIFPQLWEEHIPCLILVKSLKRG